MGVPDAIRVLEIWETSLGESPVGVGLKLLAAAGQDASDSTVGALNAQLLRLRQALFGPAINASARCPSCGSGLDLELNTMQMLRPEGVPPVGGLEIEVEDYRVSFHVPRALDASAAATCTDPMEARRVLLNRCVAEARRNGEEVRAEDLPESVCRAIGERMGVEDPQGDLLLAVSCPSCGHHWEAPLDVAAYLMREINS